MKQWQVLFRKEMLDLWRSYKWLWVPLVFVALGIMQPAATYYLPDIIDSVGGLPEGAVIEIPAPMPGEVLAETLGQLNTIGMLVLVLSAMGTLVGERNSGSAAMLLVKPVSYAAFVTAKWAAYALLTLVAVGLGQLAAWYYTEVLIGPFPIQTMLASTLVFAVWLSFVLTVLMLAGALLRSAAAVAFVAIGTALLLAIATGLFGDAMDWSPNQLSAWATGVLVDAGGNLVLPLAVTAALIAALLPLAAMALRQRQLAA